MFFSGLQEQLRMMLDLNFMGNFWFLFVCFFTRGERFDCVHFEAPCRQHTLHPLSLFGMVEAEEGRLTKTQHAPCQETQAYVQRCNI